MNIVEIIKDSLDDAFRNPDEGADDGDDEY